MTAKLTQARARKALLWIGARMLSERANQPKTGAAGTYWKNAWANYLDSPMPETREWSRKLAYRTAHGSLGKWRAGALFYRGADGFNAQSKGLRTLPECTEQAAWEHLRYAFSLYKLTIDEQAGTVQGSPGSGPVTGITAKTVLGPAGTSTDPGAAGAEPAPAAWQDPLDTPPCPPSHNWTLPRYALGNRVPPDRLPFAPALAAAFRVDTRMRHRRTEDGDTLHPDAAPQVALGLRDSPALAIEERRRTGAPAILLLLDASGSMSDPANRRNYETKRLHAAQAAHAIAQACHATQVPIEIVAFDDTPQLVKAFRDPLPRAWHELSGGNTELANAFRETLPRLAARREPRKIALVVTDGDAQESESARVLAHFPGIEVYGIGIGVDLKAEAVTRKAPYIWKGDLALDDSTQLTATLTRELRRIIHRG